MAQQTHESNQDQRKSILVLTHDDDRSLYQELYPYWLMLSHCYPAFNWYEYPIPWPMMAGNKTKYETFLSMLEQNFLIILCTSAPMVNALWTIHQEDEWVATALSRAAIATISLRSTPFVGRPLNEQPLCSYEKGHPRETACTEIITKLDQHLRTLLGEYAPAFLPAPTFIQQLYQTIDTHQPRGK